MNKLGICGGLEVDLIFDLFFRIEAFSVVELEDNFSSLPSCFLVGPSVTLDSVRLHTIMFIWHFSFSFCLVARKVVISATESSDTCKGVEKADTLAASLKYCS